MKVLFDTSVLVASLVECHPAHERCFPWMRRARRKEIELLVAAHSVAEAYAVLTRLPISPRIQPAQAVQLVEENIERRAKVISLAIADYASVVRQVADLGLAGAVIHDALIARAATKSGAKQLVTLNPDDFRRVLQKRSDMIVVP